MGLQTEIAANKRRRALRPPAAPRPARTRHVVGIDAGSHAIRAAWVQVRGGAATVVRVEQMVLPVDAADPVRLVRPWLDKLGLHRSFCAIALPGGQTVFQTGRLAPEDPRTARQAAAIELATFNEMAGDTMQFDVSSLEWRPGTRLYLMAMARPSSIERALAAAAPLGIRPADLVPAPVALFRGLDRLAGPHDAPYLYLNVGHQQTELAIGATAGLLFARAVPMGGRAFTDAVAAASGTPPQQAEVQKHREASLLPGAPFADALRPVAERWLSQVSSCLSVYRSGFTGDAFAPAQAVLSGGGAQLRGLAEFVRTRLNLPVVQAEALPDAAEAQAPGTYDLAVGLAICAQETGSARLSLLPSHLRDEVVFSEKKPYWFAAAGLGALALGIFAVGMVRDLKREARHLDEERSQLRKREQMDQGISQFRKRSTALRARAEPLKRMLLAGPSMRAALALVANTIGPQDWISMICEDTSYLPKPEGAATRPASPDLSRLFLPGFRGGLRAQPAAAAKPSSPPEGPTASDFRIFVVEGYTPDVSLKSVREMLQKLRTDSGVSKADLLSDDRVLSPSLPDAPDGVRFDVPDMRRFVLRLELRQP